MQGYTRSSLLRGLGTCLLLNCISLAGDRAIQTRTVGMETLDIPVDLTANKSSLRNTNLVFNLGRSD